MKISRTELVLVGLLIAYIAFFTHPPPSHIKDFLSSPVGHAVFLLGIVYVTVRQSLVVGVFLGIAYLVTSSGVTEYLDAKEQSPKKALNIGEVLKSLSKEGEPKKKLEKGDTVAHTAVAGKSKTAPPPQTSVPTGAPSSGSVKGTSV
jgi:hypothetical protein